MQQFWWTGSLDELATMVVDKFAEAKNADLPPPMFDSSPFDADQLKVSHTSTTIAFAHSGHLRMIAKHLRQNHQRHTRVRTDFSDA